MAKDLSLKDEQAALRKNPALPVENHANAFRHSEGVEVEAETLIKVNEMGLPLEEIKVEAYSSDYAGYWRLKEKPLWTILGFCLLYLALKLFGV